MNVGSAVKRLRVERGMSMSRLAAKTGIAKSYLSVLESGKHRNPTLDVIIRLSVGLDAHIAEVLSIRVDNLPTITPQPMRSPPPKAKLPGWERAKAERPA